METKKEIKWRLKSFEYVFKHGYKHENTVDRYEGKVTFDNNQNEGFTIKISEETSTKFMELIANELVRTSSEFNEQIIKLFKK